MGTPREGGYWRVEFVQPATLGDDRCVMLYGLDGEIVGPMTMELAEAWMDRFDNRLPGVGKEVAPHNDASQPND